MNFIGTFVLGLTITTADTLPHRTDPWWGKDKALHFAISYTAYNVFSWVQGEGGGESAALALSLGVLKELYDWKIKGSSFSYKDLLYDAGGILLALVLSR